MEVGIFIKRSQELHVVRLYKIQSYGILSSRVFVVGRGLGKGFSLKKENIAFGKG
jgi:hypothetical protein